MKYNVFVHSPVFGHLDYFHFGAVRSNAAMNTHTHVFVRSYVFKSFAKIPRSGILGSEWQVYVLLKNKPVEWFSKMAVPFIFPQALEWAF